MLKKLFFITSLIIFTELTVFAEITPLNITPAEIISTKKDQIKVGDYLKFKAVSNVYMDGELIIKKDTLIEGLVDFVHPNGWFADYAIIKLDTFSVTDENNNKMTINSPLTINGASDDLNNIQMFFDEILSYTSKGKEIHITPGSKIFTLFINQ